MTVDKWLHNKNTELHNDSGENSEKVTSFISTVDIDKRIDEILSEDRYLSASNVVEEEPFFWRFNKDFKTEVKDSVKSLIREVAEEVTPSKVIAVKYDEKYDHNDGNTHATPDYALGWNDCISEQRTKLNKMIGDDDENL